MADLRFERSGAGICSVYADTDEGKKWLRDNVQAACWQQLGSALVMEMRCAFDIAEGAANDGLEVE